MAVTNVAKVKASILQVFGWDAKETSNGFLSVNINEEIDNTTLHLLYQLSFIHKVDISIKRSGAGLRILFK